MLAIYIVALLVLLGSDLVPSNAQSHSSDDDDHDCKSILSLDIKIKLLLGTKDLPECTCGPDGTISKVDIFHANSKKTTTVLICAGCTGPQVPVTISTLCKNFPHILRPVLNEFCQIGHPRCKSITVFRCDCPAEITTQGPTTPVKTTDSVTPAVTTASSSIPMLNTTITQPEITTQGGIFMPTTSLPPTNTTQPGIGFPSTDPPSPNTTQGGIFMPTTSLPPPITTITTRSIYITPIFNPNITLEW